MREDSQKKSKRLLTGKPANGALIDQKTINQLENGNPTDRIVWDSKLRGFGVRASAKGVISFLYNYRIHGRERRYTIGRHPAYTANDARDEAMRLYIDIKNGHDPLDERNEWKSEPTFKALADGYVEDVETQKRESSRYEDRRMLSKTILPKFGARRLSEITRDDIVKLRDTMRATPYQANRVLSLLSSIFNYGIKREWIEKNPAKGVERFEERPRESYLNVEQLQRFREALDQHPQQDSANALKLLLLTGSRMGEVLSATWEEFDLAHGLWHKPSHHVKQKRNEHVPLNAPTITLLESMAPANASGPLFSGKKGKRKGKETGSDMRVSLRRPWIAACKAAELVKAAKDENGKIHYKPTIRIHDLRHNFASYLISNGVTLQVVGKMLGHTQAQTTMRYAHIQDAPLRAAADLFGDIYTQKKLKEKKRRA